MIDLKELADERGYKTTLDPAAAQEPRSEWLWLWRVPGYSGFIGVHGAETLAIFAGTRMLPKLLAIPGAHLHQRGDDEVSVLVPAPQFEAVAQAIRAKRRRQARPGAADHLAGHRFAATR